MNEYVLFVRITSESRIFRLHLHLVPHILAHFFLDFNLKRDRLLPLRLDCRHKDHIRWVVLRNSSKLVLIRKTQLGHGSRTHDVLLILAKVLLKNQLFFGLCRLNLRLFFNELSKLIFQGHGDLFIVRDRLNVDYLNGFGGTRNFLHASSQAGSYFRDLFFCPGQFLNFKGFLAAVNFRVNNGSRRERFSIMRFRNDLLFHDDVARVGLDIVREAIFSFALSTMSIVRDRSDISHLQLHDSHSFFVRRSFMVENIHCVDLFVSNILYCVGCLLVFPVDHIENDQQNNQIDEQVLIKMGIPTERPIISPKLILLSVVVSTVLVTPLVITLEEVTPKEPIEAPTERALAREEVAAVADPVEVVLLPELGSASPVTVTDPSLIEVKVTASTRSVLSFMALSSQATKVSTRLRTEAALLALRVKLNPTFTLFWHIQFFLTKPSTQDVQQVVEAEQVRQGRVQLMQVPWAAELGMVQPAAQLVQMEELRQVGQRVEHGLHLVPLTKQPGVQMAQVWGLVCLHCLQLLMTEHFTQVAPAKTYPDPCPQSVQLLSALHAKSKSQVVPLRTEPQKQVRQWVLSVSEQVLQGSWQFQTQDPSAAGWQPESHFAQMFPLHFWHREGQVRQVPLERQRYALQEVHLVMLSASQLEHCCEHLRQVPLLTTNPYWQAEQETAEVQFRQFRGQEAQEVPLQYSPGRQLWQLVADPLQLVQVASQSKQLVPDRKDPLRQAEQALGFETEQAEHPGGHRQQTAESESKTYPSLQAAQTPVEQSLQPGAHSLIIPSMTT